MIHDDAPELARQVSTLQIQLERSEQRLCRYKEGSSRQFTVYAREVTWLQRCIRRICGRCEDALQEHDPACVVQACATSFVVQAMRCGLLSDGVTASTGDTHSISVSSRAAALRSAVCAQYPDTRVLKAGLRTGLTDDGWFHANLIQRILDAVDDDSDRSWRGHVDALDHFQRNWNSAAFLEWRGALLPLVRRA